MWGAVQMDGQLFLEIHFIVMGSNSFCDLKTIFWELRKSNIWTLTYSLGYSPKEHFDNHVVVVCVSCSRECWCSISVNWNVLSTVIELKFIFFTSVFVSKIMSSPWVSTVHVGRVWDWREHSRLQGDSPGRWRSLQLSKHVISSQDDT